MEDIKNLTQDDVLELIRDFPIVPRHRRSVITLNVRERGDNELDLEGQNGLSDTQFIVSTSDSSGLKAGQKVMLDLTKLMKIDESRSSVYESVGQIQITPIEIEGKVFAMVEDNVIVAEDNR